MDSIKHVFTLALWKLWHSYIFISVRSFCVWLSWYLFVGPLSLKQTMTQLELCGAKNGTAAFFKWHKFVSLYLPLTSLAWERRRGAGGGGGGQLWRDDFVWIRSCFLTGSRGSDPVPCKSGGFPPPVSTGGERVLHYLSSPPLPNSFHSSQ